MSHLAKAVSPTDLANLPGGPPTFKPLDLAKLAAKGRSVGVTELKVDRKSVTVKIKGNLTTAGITHLSNEYGDKYSFGLELDASTDVSALEGLVGLLDAAITQYPDAAEDGDDGAVSPLEAKDYEARSPFKDDVLYIKCPVDEHGKAFTFGSNLKVSPKKLPKDLARGLEVDVYVTVKGYWSQPTETEGGYKGLTLAVLHVDWHVDGSAPATVGGSATTPKVTTDAVTETAASSPASTPPASPKRSAAPPAAPSKPTLKRPAASKLVSPSRTKVPTT